MITSTPDKVMAQAAIAVALKNMDFNPLIQALLLQLYQQGWNDCFSELKTLSTQVSGAV
jgi:hypothetical protein